MSEPIGSALSCGLAVRLDVDYEPIPKTSDQEAADYVDRAAAFVGAVQALLA